MSDDDNTPIDNPKRRAPSQHDRDTPRAGRPADIGLSVEVIAPEDRTPPPIIIETAAAPPPVVERGKRRKRMTRREFDETIVWPLRNVPDLIGELATEVSVIKERMKDLGPTTVDLDNVESRVADIAGSDGKGGALKALTDRVDKAESRRWWLITFLVMSAAGAGGIVWRASDTVASFRSRIEYLERRIERDRINRFLPDLPAPKE